MKIFYVFSLFIFFTLSSVVQASPLKFVPQTLKQPTSEIIHCFASGDEYFHWLHDKDGYTITRDENGYYVYAEKVNGNINPTNLVVGKNNPQDMNLEKWLMPDLKIIQEKVDKIKAQTRALSSLNKIGASVKTPTIGTINNIVVFVRFADDNEFTDEPAKFDNLYNSVEQNVTSVYNYYKEASYNRLEIISHFFPKSTGNTIISYKDAQPRDYYLPYDQTTNSIGYTEANRYERENSLIGNAFNYVKTNNSFDFNLDEDNDGYVDNITIMLQGTVDNWGNILWPHMSTLQSNVQINNKKVGNYNIVFRDITLDWYQWNSSGVGALCHELFHSLGAPDLYNYYSANNPVGIWDLMGIGFNIPQHMSAYMKYRYGKWINDIPEITTPGSYSLNPLSSSQNNCYKIKSPNSTSEYFVLEYRARTTHFETSLLGEGLLVYRINTKQENHGNNYGPPDEVYIYRPYGSTIGDGTIRLANFNQNEGRSSINDTTNPSSFLSDGQLGLLDISDINITGNSISFKVNTPPTKSLFLDYPNNPIKVKIGNPISVKWRCYNVTQVDISYTTDGLNWKSIANSVTSHSDRVNNYQWIIPDEPSDKCKIKIDESGNSQLFAISKNDFYIITQEPPSIVVLSPNGSETWEAQSTQTITWDSKYVSLVNIELTSDNGITWQKIKENITASDKSCNIEVPGFISQSCKVRISDKEFTGTFDESDKQFTIVAPLSPALTLISPKTGDVWESGSYQKISWQNLKCTAIKIEYSTDAGLTWYNIVDNYDASKNEFGWIIPDVNSSNCKVRISGLDDVNNIVESNSSLSFISSQSYEFWIKTNTFGGRKIETIILNKKGELIASCYKSTDNGNSWLKMNFGSEPINEICALAMNKDKGTLFAISSDCNGFFRSTDDGNSWQKLNDVIPMGSKAIAIDATGNIFVAELGGGRVFESVDNGISFTQIGEILEKGNPWCMAVNKKGEIFIGSLYKGLQISRDGGKTWSSYWINNIQNEVTSIVIDEDESIYAGGGLFFGVGKSTDNGLTWENKFNGFSCPYTCVASLFLSNDGNIYAGTWAYGLYKSTDKGNSWVSMNGPNTKQIFSLAIDRYRSIYLATMQGVNKQPYLSNNWSLINNGITGDYMWDLLVDKDNNILAGSRTGIHFSSDYGSNWEERNNSIVSEVLGLYETSKGTIIAGLNCSGSRRSTDKGNTWEEIKYNGGGIGPFEGFFEEKNSGCIYATIPGYLCRSYDDGKNWELIFSAMSWKFPWAFYCKRVAVNNRGDIFLGTYDGPGLLYSKDNGQTWDSVAAFSRAKIFDLKIDKDDIIYVAAERGIGSGQLGGDKGGLYKSTDNSMTWKHITTEWSSGYQILLTNSDETIIARYADDKINDKGGYSLILHYSTDRGTTWQELKNDNLSNTTLSSFALDKNNYLYAATDDGTIYRSSKPFDPKPTSINDVTFIPKEYSLSQNYPNPFNPSTIINYQLPKQAHMTLKIYDILGREVKTLVDEIKNAGNYKIEFNASNLSSGIYFYRLQSNSFSQTKKLILLK